MTGGGTATAVEVLGDEIATLRADLDETIALRDDLARQLQASRERAEFDKRQAEKDSQAARLNLAGSRGEVERLTRERDAAKAEVDQLTGALNRTYAEISKLRTLLGRVRSAAGVSLVWPDDAGAPDVEATADNVVQKIEGLRADVARLTEERERPTIETVRSVAAAFGVDLRFRNGGVEARFMKRPRRPRKAKR